MAVFLDREGKVGDAAHRVSGRVGVASKVVGVSAARC
jgi:hypothetical protein